MKKLCILLSILVFKSGIVYASENFFNEDWWKTATVEDVKSEIENGADVNKIFWKQKVLILAAKNNDNPEIIKLLIDAGADVDQKGIVIDDGKIVEDTTALIEAAKNDKKSEIVKALLDAGANVNVKDENYCTALLVAKLRHNEEIANIIIDAGASFNEKEFYICAFGVKDWWKTATVADVENAIKSGIDVNEPLNEMKGYTVLMAAVASVKNPDVIKLLIANGADVNQKITITEGRKSVTGVTVLMIAARSNGNSEIIKLLLDEGADINAKCDDGITALITSIFGEHPDITKLLIQTGADVNVYTNVEGGGTALTFAIKEEEEYGPEIVKMLIDAGADVNVKDNDGETPLMAAARYGNIQIVKMLIDAGADVNAKDTYGHTALYYAKLFKKQEIMEFLQAYQSNFNEFDEMFAECYSIQNIGSYANKFCECAIKTAIKALGVEDQQKAQEAFKNARIGTFKNLIQKGETVAFKQCY